jgi:hypothetical protein
MNVARPRSRTPISWRRASRYARISPLVSRSRTFGCGGVNAEEVFEAIKREWTGTQLRFEISRNRNETEVRFTHAGLVQESECFDVCSNAWIFYITGSLRGLIATGKGQPDLATVQIG